jgi:pilus assembly protein CpaC
MHRTLIWFRGLLGGALLALLLGGLPAVSLAQPVGGVSGTAVYVPTGGTIRLQMSTKKPIAKVNNPRESVLGIRTVFGDPTTILLTGQQSDVTKLELVDENGVKETYDVIVQRDVENLKTQLKRAAPTSNVVATPISDNTVILSGTVTNPEDVDVLSRVATSLGFQVINSMRVGGVQQVQLDVIMAAVSRTDLRSMTFNFLTNSRNFYFGQNVGGAIGSIGTAGSGGAIHPVAFGGPLVGTVGTANVLTGVLHDGWGFLAFLEALRSESVVKFVAEPHVITMSGRPSSFHSGGQQAVPSGGGINGVGAQFIPFGTDINFLPVILGNGKIYLEVDVHQDELAASTVNIGGAQVANRTSNSVTTTAELEAGQTFVIGGIMTHTVQGNTDKIPVIGDVPFFGTFFNSKSYNETEEEVIILVTPHLIDAQDCSQVTKILPGQETRRPDDFELFLEGILEAPRGQREVFQDHHYVPAYKNGPSAGEFPCGLNGGCGINGTRGGCSNSGGAGSCSGGCNGSCGVSVTTASHLPIQAAAPAVARPEELRMPVGPAVVPAPAPVEFKDVTPLPDGGDKPMNLLVIPGGERKE